MAEIDVLKAQLVRTNEGVHWGFRLQGGVEPHHPIIIASVRPGSPADKIGLKAGDEVTEIGDTPTANLTIQAALNSLKPYGLSLILTVERRARGPVPTHPVVSSTQSHGTPDLKHYQPYDLSGGHPAPRHPPQCPPQQPQNYEFHTVSARPYDPPPNKPYPARPQGPPQDYSNGSRHQQNTPDTGGYPDTDLAVNGAHQSRSFKMLASLMQNEDSREVNAPPVHSSEILRASDDVTPGAPHQSRTFKILQDMVGDDQEQYSGTSGLPPPRSAAMERQRAEAAAAQQNPSRVKVFMPQQYNTPLGMYSADNIMDTFQNQAEGHLENTYEQQERKAEPPSMTSTQQVVLQQDQRGGSAF